MSKSHCLASHALLRQLVTPVGSGRHHSLMSAFAVKIQVLNQTLVRNLQFLPACCFHVLHIVRACFYISLWGIQHRYVGIIFPFLLN